MFYAQFVLSKKGPLAKIWLAAHWEKKLTKSQVYETNIDKAVESILEPKVKMALRTTGHLLLGIVRIYSRKAKYLLADCNEAFIKIKMAFRPGLVDLPEDGREANPNAITLPEVFHDFDVALPEFNELDYQTQLTANQSRREDITLSEELPQMSTALPQDDGFGDGGFDDSIELDKGDFSSMLTSPRRSEITLRQDDFSKRMDIDAPAEDDFGGELDEHLFSDIDQLFNDGLAATTSTHHAEDMDFELVGHHIHDDESDGVSDVGTAITGRQAQVGGIPSGVSSIISGAVTTRSMISDEQTTLIHNEDETFALEPLDSIVMQGADRHRAKRRRKLVVDDVKAISGDDMKFQLSDPSDTMTQLDLAPPTKKLMHWKETGGVDKLFALSGLEMASKTLNKLYASNHLCCYRDEEDAPGDDHLQLSDAGSGRTSPAISHQQGASALESILEQSHLDIARDQSEVLPVIPEERSGLSPGNQPEPFSPWVPPEDPPTPFNDLEAPPLGLEHELGDRTLAEAEEQLAAAAQEELAVAMEEESGLVSDEIEDRRWNKRTQAFLNTIQNKLSEQDESFVFFRDLTRRNTRKQAAQKFYTLLVLKKWHQIEVEQSEPFSDIVVRASSNVQPTTRT